MPSTKPTMKQTTIAPPPTPSGIGNGLEIFTQQEYKRFCETTHEVNQIFMLMKLFRANGVKFDDDIISFRAKKCLPNDTATIMYQIYQYLYLCDVAYGDYIQPPTLRPDILNDYYFLFRCEFQKEVEEFMEFDE